MKRTTLERILFNYYGDSSVRSLMNGTRKPSYENMLMLNEKHKVPFKAWIDIKSYLQQNSTKTNETIARPQEEENKATA